MPVLAAPPPPLSRDKPSQCAEDARRSGVRRGVAREPPSSMAGVPEVPIEAVVKPNPLRDVLLTADGGDLGWK